jgi:hypothetical protein
MMTKSSNKPILLGELDDLLFNWKLRYDCITYPEKIHPKQDFYDYIEKNHPEWKIETLARRGSEYNFTLYFRRKTLSEVRAKFIDSISLAYDADRNSLDVEIAVDRFDIAMREMGIR